MPTKTSNKNAAKRTAKPAVTVASPSTTKEDRWGRGALFIPAGLFLGFGLGFWFENLPAGMFTGFGLGFAAFAISMFFEK